MKKAINVNGTSLQGYITIKFADLVSVLGKPHFENGDKITAEWAIQIGDAVITIYDYKEDVTPKGLYDWHVGGFDSSVVVTLQRLFPNYRVRNYRA